MIPISPYTYNCTIHHIRTVPMSPQLYCFTIMSGAVGEDTRGKEWSRTTIFGFSVRRIDLLCYLPIYAESRGIEPHTLPYTQFSRMVPCLKDLLSIKKKPSKNWWSRRPRITWRATDWRNGGWLRRLHYHVGFYLLLRCALQHLTATDTVHQAVGLLWNPWLRHRHTADTPMTYPGHY